MQKKQWRKIEAIIDKAITLSGNERDDYIREVCEGDKRLLTDVYEILKAMEKSEESDFLSSLSSDHEQIMTELLATSKDYYENWIGKSVGSFEITDILGTGGMSIIFKAERTQGPFSQVVAIKLLQKELQSPETIQRFHIEQEILAGLKHPNIAQLYDGGVTHEGIPYLIMEYIDGISIDEYCNKYRRSIDERLQLFCDVCSAVQHAHSNLIIHRDLKADNILVTSDGVVKVLDFGIAKFLDPTLSEHALLETRPGQKLWTPQYAAPEQVKDQAPTTATDIYALGILLHKLLTDTYPLDLRNKKITEIEQTIIHDVPVKPSEAINRLGNTDEICSARRMAEDELRKKLSGDLDEVVLKAIRKDPDYRYASVGQFMDDIDRYDQGFPLIAPKDTARYRLSKFVKRHKAVLISIGAVLVLTGTIIGYYTYQLRIRTHEAEIGEQKARKTMQVLVGIFRGADPTYQPGKDVTAREVLEKGTAYIRNEIGDQPEIRASLLDAVGGIYKNLGEFEEAGPVLHEALEIRRELYPDKHIDLAGSMHNWADYNMLTGNYDQAIAYFQQAGEMYKSLNENRKYALSIMELGWVFYEIGKYHKADSLVAGALEINLQELGPEHPEVARGYHYLGWIQNAMGRYDTSDSLFRQALDIRKNVYDDNHPLTAQTMQSLGRILYNMGKYEAAEQMEKQALAVQRNVLENDHPEVATTLNILGLVKVRQQNYDEAEALFLEAIDIRRRKFGNDHPDVLKSRNDLATVYFYKKDYNRASKEFKKVVEFNKTLLGETHPEIATGLNNLAMTLQRAGRKKEALNHFRESIAIAEQNYDPGHNYLLHFRGNLATLYEEIKQYGDAIRLWTNNFEVSKSNNGLSNRQTKKALQHLVECYQKLGEDKKAGMYEKFLAQAEE